ncbi:MAG: hypothetical protein ACR2K3_10125 [Nocardioides sp.]
MFDHTSLAADLVPPGPGHGHLRHDQTFRAWDATFSECRDVINHGIDLLNHVGVGLRRLPGGSLERLLVVPLAGDYEQISRNAEACAHVRRGCDTWARNIVGLSLAMVPLWDGRAAAAFFAEMSATALAVAAVGEVVGAGSRVFDEIALISERLGVEVERVIVALGRLLARVAARVLEKIGGVGAAVFAAEIALKGLDTVRDLVHDIELVLELVDEVVHLREAVAEWADEQRERLRIFAELPAVLRGLRPVVSGGDSMTPELAAGLAELHATASEALAAA